MNTAFISVLSAGSHLNAVVGAVTLTIGKVFNAWVITPPQAFEEAIADEAGLRPIDSEDRHKAYKALVKEAWPRCAPGEAFDQMQKMMKACGVGVTVWDEDATSYIDAHAMLWTFAPAYRPALRRLEGEIGNLHMGSVFCMAAIDAGSRAQCNLNAPLMRAIKCNTIVRQAIDRLWPGSFTREVKEPESLKGTYVERDFAAEYDAKPTELKTVFGLPPVPPAKTLALPGSSAPTLSLPTSLKLPG